MDFEQGVSNGRVSYIFQHADGIVTYGEIIKQMNAMGETDGRRIDQGISELLNRGEIKETGGGYIARRAGEAAAGRPGAHAVSRLVFDAMGPQAKMDWVNSGGIVT
jgi:hypothetical protein